jgi:crotonobetaine/carnitine-CoA ligase
MPPSTPPQPQSWTDPRMPNRNACVLRYLLEHWAAKTPDKTFAVFPDGSEWSYARLLTETRCAAAGLQALGVRQGDTVLFWLPNSPDGLKAWFAINYLGAVFVPINLAYRGRLLEHVIDNAGARVMLAHAPLVERLADISCAQLTDLVVFGESPNSVCSLPGLRLHSPQALETAGKEPTALEHPIEPWDTNQIIYTSGTTGPSKGVICSYLKAEASDVAFSFMTSDDRYLINLPLFHVSGAGAVMQMLRRGGSVAIVESFSTSKFWSVVTQTGSTACTLLGVMATFLAKEPESPKDREHSLRNVMMVPLSEDAPAFSRRFGCDVYTTFNMTETSCPIVSGRNPTVLGTCGQVRAGMDARIVDSNDCEVAPGTAGELLLRSDTPWALTQGYYRAAEATASAWRNGWFHTGDAFRRDAQGNYFFVDRIKDAIRRRGENISSFEVEAEVCAYPAVREAAAYAVPSDVGEDEVMVAIALNADTSLNPVELIAFLSARMAHFMVPRYVRVVAELPKTPTQKVQKTLLRAEGVTTDSFDRIAASRPTTLDTKPAIHQARQP